MPIAFTCACGRPLRVANEYAGKNAKCPACGAVLAVPAPEPEEDDLEILEEDAPAAVRPGAPPARPSAKVRAAGGGKTKSHGKKKARKRSPAGRDYSLADQYLAQAESEWRRDEATARAAGGWGSDNSGGWTMFGIHLTAGVLAGAGMVFAGLVAMLVIALFRDELNPIGNVRLFVGAGVCITLGAITFIKAAFFGQEE